MNGLAAFVLRFVLFLFDVVVDVPGVQVVDVGSWGHGPDSAARGVPQLQFSDLVETCPLLWRQVHEVQFLDKVDMPVVATTGAVLGQGGHARCCDDRCSS